MDGNTRIRLIKKLNITDMSGDKVMIDFETGKYFLLKGTASDIWDCIQKEISVEEIVLYLMDQYEVDRSTCLQGVEKFLLQLEKYGFVTIESK